MRRTWAKNAAYATSVAGAAGGGVYLGARFHDSPLLRYAFVQLGAEPDSGTCSTGAGQLPLGKDLDRSDPASVVAAAVRLANRSGGLAVLATTTKAGGVHARVMQPLPVTLSAQKEPVLTFHTTTKSRKAAELAERPECAVVFLNAREQTCVSFTGTAVRCGKEEEAGLAKSWPLFPPLSLLFPGKTIGDFGAWTLRPRAVEVVSPGLKLVTKGRPDWGAPQVAWNETDGAWEFAVPPFK